MIKLIRFSHSKREFEFHTEPQRKVSYFFKRVMNDFKEVMNTKFQRSYHVNKQNDILLTTLNSVHFQPI